MQLFSCSSLPQPNFLPMSRQEMDLLGWDELDILLVSGDAYVDHPSFAMAILGRVLVAHGFRTGIITQPRWTTTEDVLRMGRPRLFAGVSAGAMDSMLAHYTAFRKKRSDDAYTPGGRAGARPNRACIVYTNILRQAFPGLTIVLGGIEASLRRISHYDFWSDSLRKPLLLDAKADILVYGMGERALINIATRLQQGQSIKGIAGTVMENNDLVAESTLPSHEEILAHPSLLMQATLQLEAQVHQGKNRLIQKIGQRTIVIEPPARILSSTEMDRVYALPYTRQSHPHYKLSIPAQVMIQDSVTSHRGCGGGCSFCTLALHQGRHISSRSKASIIQEVQDMAGASQFKGFISDVGGPSANMWNATCTGPQESCSRSSCMTPSLCPHFQMNHKEHLDLLRGVRQVPKVRGVRVASGVRFDLALKDKKTLSSYLEEFVGGQLKIAPEHICDHILRLMRKPGHALFENFLHLFSQVSAQAGKKQFVVPYLMSAFPGTKDEDMQHLAQWLQNRGWSPKQVQCFIPIPGAVATAMYYARITPKGHPIYVAQSDRERLKQHKILIPGPNKDHIKMKKARPQLPVKKQKNTSQSVSKKPRSSSP